MSRAWPGFSAPAYDLLADAGYPLQSTWMAG
jgi:hypothetical protein